MLDDLIELPEGWEETTIGEISEVITGSTPPKKDPEFFNGDIPFFKPTDLDAGYEVYNAREFLSELGASKSRLLPKKSILVTCIGATIGKTGFARVKCATNQQINAVVVPENHIIPEWFFWLVCGPQGQQSILDNSSATTLPILNKGRFIELKVPLPPLNEQKRIVAKIEELRSHTQAARNAIAHIPKLLEQFRQSVLAAAFRGDLTAEWRSENPDVEPAEVLLERIRKERRDRWELAELEKMRSAGKIPKDDKWKSKYKEPDAIDEKEVEIFLDELPEGWLLLSADQCTSMITDGEHATPERTEQGVYLLSARNVLDGRISLKKVDYISEETHLQLEKRFKIEEGDIFLSCSGSVGRSCTVPKSLRCSLVRSVAILKPLFGMGNYISLSIRSPHVQSQIESKKTQTAQANIFQGRIKTLAIPVAPLKEQKAVLDIVQESFISIDRIEEQYQFIKTELDRLDRSILAKAFKGELVPQDPTDEPAIVLLERIRDDRASQPSKKVKRSNR